jgi:hypothetical protein
VRIVVLESGQSVLFLVPVLESNIIYCSLGTLYRYTLLEGPKINKVWRSYHKFHLAHPIFIRPVELQRRCIRELQNKISDPEGSKFWRYNRRKIV